MATRNWKRWTLLPALLLALALAGCGEDGDPAVGVTGDAGGDDFAAMDLNDPTGGLTATDEPAGFGDDYFASPAVAAEFAEADDPLAEDAEVLMYEAMAEEPAQLDDPADPARPKFTFLKVTWGMLDGLTEDAEEDWDAYDWSGLLRVDRGLVVVRRVILFEQPYDHLVRPRIDRRTVAWISHTGPHYDGLLVEIIEPPLDPAVAADAEPLPENVLHFTTPQFSRDFPMSTVGDLDLTEAIDGIGNAIRFEGFRLSDIDVCPKGFLSGLWLTTGERRGEFKGKWVGLYGLVKGHLRGRWGVNDEGEQVFFGKYIARDGRFLGLLRGRWEPGVEPGHGVFHGHWLDADGAVTGVLRGGWFQVPDRPGGFFSGRWATLCDAEAAGSIE